MLTNNIVTFEQLGPENHNIALDIWEAASNLVLCHKWNSKHLDWCVNIAVNLYQD